MKAISVRNGRGNADAMFVDDSVPDPVLKDGYVLVTIKAFGLNRMDIMQREDRYPYKLLPESGNIMGVEFAGLVEAIGANCTSDFKKGDRVFGLAYGGAYAERILISEKMLMHLPDNLSFVVGAGIPEVSFLFQSRQTQLKSSRPSSQQFKLCIWLAVWRKATKCSFMLAPQGSDKQQFKWPN